MTLPLTIPPELARRFLRSVHLLDQPAPNVAAAIAHHGYIQIDPINVTGRMHDLILRNRVANYREGDLIQHLHGDGDPFPPAHRTAFEHHLPDTGVLVAFPVSSWPHLLKANADRSRRSGAWSGRLTPREREIAKSVIAEVTARGPLRSADFADERRARRVWGTMRLVKSVMQKLFFHGQLLIAGRSRDHHRLYDLPSRVLPRASLQSKAPSQPDTARWLVLTKLRQRRLVKLNRTELPLVEDLVRPVNVAGCPVLYCFREDLPWFDKPVREVEPTIESILLAPLDPLIYDRRLTSDLWNFDYTWEAYTPPAKRRRGYYALPVLAGTKLIGHVEPKADRSNRKLQIVTCSVRRGHPVKPAINSLARWLGLTP